MTIGNFRRLLEDRYCRIAKAAKTLKAAMELSQQASRLTDKESVKAARMLEETVEEDLDAEERWLRHFFS
jgi:hypothetical protein